MTKDKGGKTPSADEIIEALAAELGVEDDAGEQKKKAKPAEIIDDDEDTKPMAPAPLPPEPKKPKAVKKAEAKPPPVPPKAATPPPVPAVSEKKPTEEPPTTMIPPEELEKKQKVSRKEADKKEPSPAKPVAVRSIHDPTGRRFLSPSQTEAYLVEGGLSALFADDEADASIDDDPYVGEYDDDDDDVLNVRTGAGRSIVAFLVVMFISVAGLGGTYLAIPAEFREDIVPLIQGEDIQLKRRQRRAELARMERIAWLESRPKYGTIRIATRPGFSLIEIEGQPRYVEHPDNPDWLVETRSGTVFDDMDIAQHYVAHVSTPNFEPLAIQLFPWGQDNSLWQQNSEDGTYGFELNEIMQPRIDLADEFLLRMTPAPEAAELYGAITIETSPSGAEVRYNGRLLVDENGNALRTPVTFNTYPPPPPVVTEDPVVDPTGEPPLPPEPLPVTLRSTGIPIRVSLDGFMTVETGIYKHMFTCELPPIEEQDLEIPLLQRCVYTYRTAVDLMTPAQFAAQEEQRGVLEGEEEAPDATEPAVSP